MKHSKELHCCLGCGRDTYGDYCPLCIGHSRGIAGRGRGYPARAIRAAPLEDDYGEESDADSVCEDDTASASRLF